jgi:2-polyprenyl-6-hydroxyphenyl methylase / 3-demethylubiquinone-9 3-methyltransferase
MASGGARRYGRRIGGSQFRLVADGGGRSVALAPPMEQSVASKNAEAGPRVDKAEVEKFNRLAAEWWNPNGKMKPLHKFNPVRLAYLRDLSGRHFSRDVRGPRPFDGLTLVDIGCGGGLLSEPLARLGFEVTGIDPARNNVDVAKIHAEESGVPVTYRKVTAETLAEEGARFDVVLAMEVVEHVPDVDAFVATATGLVKPGGLFVGATINRTKRSFALAIVGAEYVLRWLPVGTHSWDKFVTPSELEGAIAAGGLDVTDRRGVVFNPFTDRWSLSRDMAVNYMLAAFRAA